MKKKIISLILTCTVFIQVPLTHIGCSSAYPTKGDTIFSDESRIFYKIKNKTELNVTNKVSDLGRVTEKNITDSTQIIAKKIFSVMPDSANSIWIVNNTNKDGVEIQKANWISTFILTAAGIIALIFLFKSQMKY